MKKFIFSSLFLLATVFAFGSVARAQYNPTFTITKPSNLETWEKGQSYEVRWKTNGNVSPEALVSIYLDKQSLSGNNGQKAVNLISVEDNNYCTNSNNAQIDCVKLSDGKASIYLRDNLASGKYNLNLGCTLNNQPCDNTDFGTLHQTLYIVASSSVPQLTMYPVSISETVGSGDTNALLASYILDATKSPTDVHFSEFDIIPGNSRSYSSSTETYIFNNTDYLSNCAFYIEKNKVAKGEYGNPSKDSKYRIFDNRSQTAGLTIKRGSKETVDFRCDISKDTPYVKGYYVYNFIPLYDRMFFSGQYNNKTYSQNVGFIDYTYSPEVRLLTSPKEKPSKNGTLSIKALPETLTSGSNTMISYTTNANASTTLLNLVCPDGVSARWIEGKNREMCNTKVTLSRVLTPITLNVTNTSASDKEISVNFYEYLLNNIDYAIGSSTKITVKPLVVNNGVKSLDIINPQGGVMHMADSDLYVDWQANNLNVDHYYVLLQNELVNDVGLIVGDNITSTSSYLSYHFNLSKKVIDQMVKQSNGLTEGQLQNHYYVTVVAANRGFFGGSKPEYFAKSKVFYIGPSSGIMISSVNATANPLYSSNATVAYRYDISFDLSNSSSSPIYINKNLNGDGVLYSVSYREASTSRIITDSQTLAGDTNTHYYLQPGQSRRITLSGYLKNGGYSELITFKILGIMAKTEYSSVDNLKVDAGFDNARLTVYIDGRIQNTNATSSLSQIILGSPIISNNYTRYYYPVEIKFNITAQDSPVYIANLVNGKSPLVFTDSDRHIMPQLTSSNSVPDNLIGDSVFYKMVPPGASRSFSYKGTVSNIGAKYTGDKIIQVKAIKYGLSADRVDSEYIGTDNSNLKAFVYMVADENATSSTVYDPKSVYIKNARSQATGPNVQNGKVVGYNFSMAGKIVNINDDPVYIRNKNDGNDRTGFLVPNSARVEYSVNYSPISAGDSNGVVFVPARSEKDIYINGTLFSNGYNGNVSYGLNSIAYGTSTYTFDRRIQDGVSDMKVVVTFDVASSTYYSTTTVFSPKLNNLSTYSGLPGTSVIAYGQDFCPAVKNVVTFASERYDVSDDKAVISGDARSIRFMVPSLPSGVYKIFVEPSGATWNSPKCNPSNYINFTIGTSTPVYSPTPVISTSVAPKSSATPSPSVASVASTSLPYISSISPGRGGENTNVTVYGRNLSNVTSVQFYDRNGYSVRGLVPSYVSAQSVSFRITNEFAVSLPSAVYSLSLVSSNCRGGCDSNRINFELIGTAQASVSPSPSSSATRTPTPYPSASNTPYPSTSNTPTPTYSSTPVPTYSSTPVPTYSATPTPIVSSTPTPTPVSSATPTPASTPTPSASASATPTPSASSTPRPSTSSSPSPSSSPTVYNNELFRASVWVALKSIFGI